jgi:hypothetical protein
MSLKAIVKLEVPKIPKDLDDRDLEKLRDRLEKDLAAFQKSAAALLGEFDKVIGTAIKLQDAAVDAASDKNLSPKQAKAASDFRGKYYDFYGTLSDLL